MKENLETTENPRIGKVYINKENQYISYNHPTQKNENGHVKQVTRSIKNYPQETLELLCNEITELLENFDHHTNDFENIYQAEKNFKTKAYQWIIAEEIVNKVEHINYCTFEKFVPVNDYTPNTYFTLLNQNFIPYMVCSSADYVVVNDSNLTELTAVIDFKVFKDFNQDIINKLVYIINEFIDNLKNFNLQTNFYNYFKIHLNNEQELTINKAFTKIFTNFCKLYKIKKTNFTKSFTFNNYVITCLQGEHNDLAILLFDLLTSRINSNASLLSKICLNDAFEFNFQAYKLKHKSKILSKILYFKIKYTDNSSIDEPIKEQFFCILNSIFSFDNSQKSLANFIKTVRLSGNFNNSSTECFIKQRTTLLTLENLRFPMLSENIFIPIDRVFHKDFELSCLLEQVILFGFIDKCDFIFCDNYIKGIDFDIVEESLLDMLSQNTCINYYKFLYSNQILSDSKNELFKNCDDFKFTLKHDVLYDLIIFSNSISQSFSQKVTQYFDNKSSEYICKDTLLGYIKESFLYCFIKSLHGYLLNPEVTIVYSESEKLHLLAKYNSFVLNNLNKNVYYLDNFVNSILVEIFKKCELIDDYDFYKKFLLSAVLSEVSLPFKFLTEICEDFQYYL